MNISIKKFLFTGAVAFGIAVPLLMYNIQKNHNTQMLQVIEQQHKQLEQQQQEIKALHKEIDKQKKEINAVNKELKGINNLVLDSVGYIPNKEEVQLLEKLVECEAGAEPYAGKVAVANVVFNRVKSKKFPNDIYSVIYQNNQFEPVVTGMIYNRTASADSKKAVHEAMFGKKVVDPSILNFWADYLEPDNKLWQQVPVEFKIGTTCFGKEWGN
ncbi:TPA: cell wall hydrolase [Clostridium perfringens]|nr:cell wall hydrolase [Clostridium perfringens]